MISTQALPAIATSFLLVLANLVSTAPSDNFRNRGLSRSLGSQSSYQQQQCTLNPQFNTLILNVQWQPGACKVEEECRISPRAVFSVHGLWPDLVSDCCHASYTHLLMRSIEPDMQKFWPSLTGNPNFWAHEWKRHGSCGKSVPEIENQLKYFQTTLKLFKSLNLAKALSDANIVPSSESTVQYSDFVKALKKHTNDRLPKVNCKRLTSRRNETPIITSIDICYDKKLKPIDCEPTFNRCTWNLILPDRAGPPQASPVAPAPRIVSPNTTPALIPGSIWYQRANLSLKDDKQFPSLGSPNKPAPQASQTKPVQTTTSKPVQATVSKPDHTITFGSMPVQTTPVKPTQTGPAKPAQTITFGSIVAPIVPVSA